MLQYKKITLLFITSVLFSCHTVNKHGPQISRHIDVHGHRGARWVYPENTIPAFEYALQNHVDYIELDLGVTKDGVLIIVHDQTINPEICLDAQGKKPKSGITIHSLTLKQIKQYDCGSIINPRFPTQTVVPGTKIPTLQEFFDWINKSQHPHAKLVKFNIEIKSEESQPKLSPKPEVFTKKLITLLEKNKMLDRTIIQSFDFRTLKAARRIKPGVKISALIEDRPTQKIQDIALQLKANYISPNYEWLTKEDIVQLHMIDTLVAPWTVNQKQDWKRLIDMGADAIITDNPKELVDYIKTLETH